MATDSETDRTPFVDEVVRQLLKLHPGQRGAALASFLEFSEKENQKFQHSYEATSKGSTRALSESRSPGDSSESSNEGCAQTNWGEVESVMHDEGSERSADVSIQDILMAAQLLGAQPGLNYLAEQLAAWRPWENMSKCEMDELIQAAVFLKKALLNLKLAAQKFKAEFDALQSNDEKVGLTIGIACAYEGTHGVGSPGPYAFGKGVPPHTASGPAWSLANEPASVLDVRHDTHVAHVQHQHQVMELQRHYQLLDQHGPQLQFQQQTDELQLPEQTPWIPQEEFYRQRFLCEHQVFEGQHLGAYQSSDFAAAPMAPDFMTRWQQVGSKANEPQHVLGKGDSDASIQHRQHRHIASVQVPMHSVPGGEGESLQAHLRVLQSLNSKRILMARKLNRLGFDSPKLMLEYFSQFGVVDDVLVPHYYILVRSSTDMTRARPSSIGFVVMAEESAVEEVLRLGSIHVLQGKQIKITQYEHRLGDDPNLPGWHISM